MWCRGDHFRGRRSRTGGAICPMESDLTYFSRRATQERNAARGTAHRKTREIHLELAQAYEFRLYLMRELAALDSRQTATQLEAPVASTIISAKRLFSDHSSPEEILAMQPNPIPA